MDLVAPPRRPDRSREVAAAPAGEIRSLTGLRIVAAVWVVCFHFSSAPGETYSAYWAPLRPLIRQGALGVDLFFVLSGFVITLTYLDQLGRRPTARATAQFWWARICRIWPVHAVITTLFGGWLLYKSTRVTDGVLAYQTVQPVVDLAHWVEQLLMVQLWHRPFHDGSSWSGPAWSISAEWLAYACFPFLVCLLWRLRDAPAVVTGLLAVGCMLPLAYVALTPGEGAVPYLWLLRIAGGFLAGAFTCLAVRRMPRGERTDRLATGVAVLVVAEVLLVLWWSDALGGSRGAVAAVTFPVLIGALALSTRGISRWLSTETMVVGGRISFALYLVHIPVFEIVYTLMGWYPRLAPGTTLGALLLPHALLVTLPLAWLVHRYLEEPARRWLRPRGPERWWGGGRVDPAPSARRVGTGAPHGVLAAVRHGQDTTDRWPVPARGAVVPRPPVHATAGHDRPTGRPAVPTRRPADRLPS